MKFSPIHFLMGIVATLFVAVLVGWASQVGGRLSALEMDAKRLERIEEKVDGANNRLDRIERQLDK